MAELKTKLLLRNDSANNWTAANPILGKGEVGIELDTGKMKIGTGVEETSHWNDLPYFKGDIDLNDLDATNVYFAEDITLAGDYTSVGNVKLNQGTLAAAGKSVAELFTEIFTKELNPGKTEPKVSKFTITNGTSFEAGTTVTPKWIAEFNPGYYTYKSTATKEPITPVTGTGVVVSSWDISKESTVISHDVTGTGDSFVIGDDKITFTAKANYNAGNYALTNLNKLPASDVQIAAGNKTATATIYSYRNMYSGGTKSTGTITQDILKALNSKKAVKPTGAANAWEFTAKAGDEKVIFAFPTNKFTGTPKFEYFTLSWGPAAGFNKVADVEVSDKRGGENGKTTYNVYEFVPAAPYEAPTKYRVYF